MKPASPTVALPPALARLAAILVEVAALAETHAQAAGAAISHEIPEGCDED